MHQRGSKEKKDTSKEISTTEVIISTNPIANSAAPEVTKKTVNQMAEQAVRKLGEQYGLIQRAKDFLPGPSNVGGVIKELKKALSTYSSENQKLIAVFEKGLENPKLSGVRFKSEVAQFINEANNKKFEKLSADVVKTIYTFLPKDDASRLLRLNHSTYKKLHDKFSNDMVAIFGKRPDYREIPNYVDVKMENEGKSDNIILAQELQGSKWAVALNNQKLYVCDREFKKSTKNQSACFVFTNKQELNESKSNVKYIVVLKNRWISQTEDFTFCVWSQQNKFLFKTKFVPTSSFSKITFAKVFNNGQIIICEPNNINIYETKDDRFDRVKMITECSSPTEVFCFNNGWIVCNRALNENHDPINTIYRFDMISSSIKSKQIANMHSQLNSEYFTAYVWAKDNKNPQLKMLSASTLSEYDIAADYIRNGRIYCLPYAYFHIYKVESSYFAQLISFDKISEKTVRDNKGVEKTVKTAHFDLEGDFTINGNNIRCVPMANGSLFCRTDTAAGFYIFAPNTRKPPILRKSFLEQTEENTSKKAPGKK